MSRHWEDNGAVFPALGGWGVGLSVPERQAEALDTRDGLWDGLGSRAFRTLGEWTPEAGGKVVSLLFLK